MIQVLIFDVLRIDGGLVHNKFVCQYLSDILDVNVDVPKITETTALGAAYLAGLHVKLYGNIDDIANQWQLEATYTPSMTADLRDKCLKNWSKAVERVLL